MEGRERCDEAESIEVEEILEQAAPSPFTARVVLVVLRLAVTAASTLDLTKEVLVGISACELPLAHEDLVELASVEPDAATTRGRHR
jgi:hypothetical protein